MLNVILVFHILVSIVLVVVVLLQRSEGGALGIGGGGGGGPGGGLMSGTGMKGALVRTTIIFGAIFFITSLGLTTLSTGRDDGIGTDIDRSLVEEFAPEVLEPEAESESLEDLVESTTDVLGDDPLFSTPAIEDDAEPLLSDDPLGDPQ